MENNLRPITPTYRSFEPNQVLTSDQLNEFLNYFDEQDRLSRIFLSGIGIVSGFNVKYNPAIPSGASASIQVSQGAGITTDGDLLNYITPDKTGASYIDCNTVTFTHFREFDADGQYGFFNDNGPQMPLLELVYGPEASGAVSISNLPSPQNMVVLLYLETYADPSDACTGTDCDNLGIKHVKKLHTLLVSKENAAKIITYDNEFNQHYLIKTYLQLDDIATQRVPVNNANSATFAALRTSYINAIQAENTVTRLQNSLQTMLSKVNMQADASDINTLLTTLLGVNAAIPAAYFQYRYDLLRDVTDAYNELKDLFLDAVCCCCPDIMSFPKHLMLGLLEPLTDEERITKPFRHGFYKSPILSCEDQCSGLFKSQVERLKLMLQRYVPTETLPLEIKITPSSYGSLISEKAIPFYYDLNEPLLKKWNYEKYSLYKYRRNLSYRTALLDQSGPIQFSLRYNLEPHNFLRIEGVQGNNYKIALEKIHQLKEQYGLAFDVKALNININSTDTINIDDYECEFADLNLMLDAWTQEHECLLGKVSRYFSAFSTTVPGLNYLESDYYFPVEKPYFGDLVAANPVKGNVVLEEAYNVEGALGRILVEKFLNFRGCSGRDIISQVNRDLIKVPNTPVKEATLSIPADILSYAYVLMDKRPLVLPQINREVINTINTNVENLCSSARQGLVLYPQVEAVSLMSRRMLTTLSTDITALCCSAEKLELIHDEIEKRKQEILLGLNLAKFMEQHPGLEHFAGTKQGGTFVMVYTGAQVGSIPANTVIADFTLPYLCCSDCKSVSFIIPKPPVSLRLSTDSFTIGVTPSPIEIFATPSNGVVRFSPNVPGITVNGNQLLIDGNSVPDWAIEEPISFTLDDQVTGVKLTIFRSVPVNIVTDVDPNYVTSNRVAFGVESADDAPLNGYTFSWSFGDGSTSAERSPVHEYALPVSGNQARVALTVTPPGGAAPSTYTRELYFQEVSANISRTQFCDNDNGVYNITITPPDSVVNISGPGLLGRGNTVGFKPSLAGSGNWTINLNGNPALFLNVAASATASVEAAASSDYLILTSNMQNANAFEWSFRNDEGDEVHAPVTDVENPEIPFDSISVGSGETIYITLSIHSECASPSYQVSIVKPSSFEACSLDSKDNLSGMKLRLESIAGGGKLSPAAEKSALDAISLFSSVEEDYTSYLVGDFNSLVGNRIANILHSLFNEISREISDGGDGADATVIYLLVMRYGITVVRCQPEERFTNTEIMDMIDLVTRETEPSDSKSLQNIGVNVDPGSEITSFLNDVVALRANGSASWAAIEKLMTNIAYNPAGNQDV